MKKSAQKGFVYFRYIMPVGVTLMLLFLMLVSVYMYNASGKFSGAVSLGELMGNSWDTVRGYIFGSSSNKDAATLHFSRVVFGLIIAAWTLFAVGAVSRICATVTAIKMFYTGERGSSGRALFLAFVPNRVMLCVFHALTLPIFFIPMLMPTLYAKLLGTTVVLRCSPFDMAFVALALYVAEVVVICVSAGYETTNGMNLFARAPREKKPAEEWEDDNEAESDDGYGGYENRAKQEQLERIMALLNKDKDDNNEEKNEENK